MSTKRILQQVIARSRAETAALKFNRDFKRVVQEAQGTHTLKTLEAGTIVVGGDDDDPQVEKFREKHNSTDLMNDVPNIQVRAGGKTLYLTWNEAYNLGFSLQDAAETALYG